MSSSDGLPAKILWTGGWDSTFQLLHLLLEERRPVEPVYMIDENRRSLRHELMAMRQIRQALHDHHPHTRELLRAPVLYTVRDIPVPAEVAQAFTLLRAKHRIGGQYEWLAAFCLHYGVTGLQLCIHRDDQAYTSARELVEAADQGIPMQDTPQWLIFGHFEFPILEVTKPEMARIARERSWSDLMDMTWFCHRPHNDMPCGQCHPCLYTIAEGLAHRIPAHRRIHTGFRALDRSLLKLAGISYRMTRRRRKPTPRPVN